MYLACKYFSRRIYDVDERFSVVNCKIETFYLFHMSFPVIVARPYGKALIHLDFYADKIGRTFIWLKE